MRKITALAILLATVGFAKATVIDSFDVGAVELTNTERTPVVVEQTGLQPGDVIGGGRRLSLWAGGGLSTVGTASVEIDLDTGSLSGAHTSSDGLVYLNVRYGSDDLPLHADLTGGGMKDRLWFDFDGPRAPGNIIVGTGDGSVHSRSLFFLSDSKTLTFDEIGADFTDISWIELDIIRSSGFKLRAVQAIPEPAAMPICAIGLLALLWRRRTGLAAIRP